MKLKTIEAVKFGLNFTFSAELFSFKRIFRTSLVTFQFKLSDFSFFNYPFQDISNSENFSVSYGWFEKFPLKKLASFRVRGAMIIVSWFQNFVVESWLIIRVEKCLFMAKAAIMIINKDIFLIFKKVQTGL